MKELSNRTATFTDSVIRRMTRISNKYGAVNLSQGFPDFDPPAQLLDSLSTIASDPKPLYHQYSITWGSQAMREALAAKQEHFMGMPVNPNENIVVTCGSTEAMMAAMMTVTNPGDKVVIFSPFYENYGADTILSGAEPIYVPLNPPTFDFDREVLEAAFRDNDPKAIVLWHLLLLHHHYLDEILQVIVKTVFLGFQPIGVGDDITEITFCFVARRNRDFSCRRSNVTY